MPDVFFQPACKGRFRAPYSLTVLQLTVLFFGKAESGESYYIIYYIYIYIYNI